MFGARVTWMGEVLGITQSRVSQLLSEVECGREVRAWDPAEAKDLSDFLETLA